MPQPTCKCHWIGPKMLAFVIDQLMAISPPFLAAKLATTPQEMETWLLPLAEAGVDIFHCSQRRFWEPEFIRL